MPKTRPHSPTIHPLYRLFFLYIEPVFALSGALCIWISPSAYLSMTHSPSSPTGEVPIVTQIVLLQLANLYALFAFNELFILRSSSSLRVWRTLIAGMLLADLGHLYTCHPLGSSLYWRAWEWGWMDFGNIGFVYMGALTRLMFLCGVGVKAGKDKKIV